MARGARPSEDYLGAWLGVMIRNRGLRFYAYTKQVPLFFRDGHWRPLPENFTLVFSEGGRHDADIPADAARSRIFVTHAERERAGFVDGTSSDGDLPVLQGERRIGLVYHGINDLTPAQVRALRAQDRRATALADLLPREADMLGALARVP